MCPGKPGILDPGAGHVLPVPGEGPLGNGLFDPGPLTPGAGPLLFDPRAFDPGLLKLDPISMCGGPVGRLD